MSRISLALAAMLIVAVPWPSLAQSSGEDPGPCEILVSSFEDPKTSSQFSVTATTDVYFDLLWSSGLSGDHLLELRVLTPRGHLYQALHTPIGPLGGTRPVAGYPRPLPVAVPRVMAVGKDRFFSVRVTLLVGGTAIQTNSLYGTWTVHAILDGANEPCGQKEVEFLQ